MTNAKTKIKIDSKTLQDWSNRDHDGVAIRLSRRLLPIEGRGQPFFPPTVTRTGKPGPHYNIDTLRDGTAVVLVDSVGSQSNRIEPMFKEGIYSELVPQIYVEFDRAGLNEDQAPPRKVSLLDIGHRIADAAIRCTPLAAEAQKALQELGSGNAELLAKLAPTSLVFGAWDSRGESGLKIPRLLQSTIRATDVSQLSRSAGYNPPIDYNEVGLDVEELEPKEGGKEGTKNSNRGFSQVPPNEALGGVVAKGDIVHEASVNLIALKRLDPESVRPYILGLAMVGLGAAQDPFLRQGCLLVPDTDHPPEFFLVMRDGRQIPLEWDQDKVTKLAFDAAKRFKVGPNRSVPFDRDLAREDLNAGKKKSKSKAKSTKKQNKKTSKKS